MVRFVDGRRRGVVGGAKEALKKLKGMHARGRIDGRPLRHAERLFGEAEIQIRMDRITTRQNQNDDDL